MIDFIGLELIEFHDLPLKGIYVTSDQSTDLVIEISLLDEKEENYIDTTLVFGKLHHINPKNVSIEENLDHEIYSFDYHIEDNLFYGKLVCLLAGPSMDIDFSCETVEIRHAMNQ